MELGCPANISGAVSGLQELRNSVWCKFRGRSQRDESFQEFTRSRGRALVEFGRKSREATKNNSMSGSLEDLAESEVLVFSLFKLRKKQSFSITKIIFQQRHFH